MFKRILLPLDGSPLAERAIPHALSFALAFDATLVLLNVLDPTQYPENTTVIEPFNWQLRKAEAELALRQVSTRLRNKNVTVEHIIQEGRTAETILDTAGRENIDLIVLTTHGASGLSRWNTNSVVAKVVAKAYTSVLLVRAYQETSAWSSTNSAANEEDYLEASYDRILLPIDSSRRAECSLPLAVALFDRLAASGGSPTLLLASVIKPIEFPFPPPYPTEINQNIDQLMQQSREALNRYLSDMQTRVNLNCETRILEDSSIAAALHAFAEEEQVDLVVMCAHGQTGLTAWPYGSVAQNYIEYGEKHTLIVQDMYRSQVRQTAAEVSAEKYGKR